MLYRLWEALTFVLGEGVVLLPAQVGPLSLDLCSLDLNALQLIVDSIHPRRHILLVANFSELLLQVLNGPSGVANSLLVV